MNDYTRVLSSVIGTLLLISGVLVLAYVFATPGQQVVMAACGGIVTGCGIVWLAGIARIEG